MKRTVARSDAEPSQNGCVASSDPPPMGSDTSQRASVCMRRKPDARSEQNVAAENRRRRDSLTHRDGSKETYTQWKARREAAIAVLQSALAVQLGCRPEDCVCRARDIAWAMDRADA